jgi:hypothetical protein
LPPKPLALATNSRFKGNQNMKTTVNRKIAIVLTTFVLLTQPVFGQAIFGAFDCGQWVNSKTDLRKAWVLGFMSGMSMATSVNKSDGDWLNKVNSSDQIFLFIDNYCQKNPLRKIETAGVVLYIELTSK